MQGRIHEGEPAAKRRRLEGDNDSPDGHGDQQLSFGHSDLRDNSRAHFGHQYYYGTVHQGASLNNAQDAVKPAEKLRFDEMDVRRATIKVAHADTCQWLFDRLEYKKWRDVSMLPDHHGFFWIRGKPGAGKSTLMKCAVSHADRQLHPDLSISFFFNARGAPLEKSIEGMYRTLLCQLFDQCSHVEHVFRHHRAWQLPSWPIELLQEIFKAAVLQLGKNTLTCYIDALDECEESDVRDMVEFFEDLGDSAVSAGITFRVCLSSRHYPHISIAHCVHLVLDNLESHQLDIETYVQNTLKVSEPALREMLTSRIRARALGVFLWVALVVRLLNREGDRGNFHRMRQRLEDVPDGLHALFEDAVLQRGAHDTTYFIPTLLFIMSARRPLTPLELFCAVVGPMAIGATSPDTASFQSREDLGKFVLNASKGLAHVTTAHHDQEPRVQFIHETVREYLVHNGIGRLDNTFCRDAVGAGHDFVKQECHRYLLQAAKTLEFPSGGLGGTYSPASRQHRAKMMKEAPFLEYACHEMVYHAEMAHINSISQKTFVQDFPLEFYTKTAALLSLNDDDIQYPYHEVDKAYVFSCWNATSLLRLEIDILARRSNHESPADFSCGGFRGTALQAAASYGFTASAMMLIEAGADVHAKGGMYGNALQAASAGGHILIMQLLLDAGANVNAVGGHYGRALQAAAYNGNKDAVLKLLDNGANLFPKTRHCGSAFKAASDESHTEVVEAMLEFGKRSGIRASNHLPRNAARKSREELDAEITAALQRDDMETLASLLEQWC